MSMQHRSLATLVSGAALMGLASTAAADPNWTNINGGIQYDRYDDLRASQSQAFRDVLRRLQQFIPINGDGFVALANGITVNPSTIAIRSEAKAAAFMSVGNFTPAYQEATLTAEPRVDYANGTYVMQASSWAWLPGVGWTNVWSAPPTSERIVHSETQTYFLFRETLRVGTEVPVVGNVSVEGRVTGLLQRWSSLDVSASGAIARVGAQPGASIFLNGHTSVSGTIQGAMTVVGAGADVNSTGYAGLTGYNPNIGGWEVCAGIDAKVRMTGLGAAWLWSQRSGYFLDARTGADAGTKEIHDRRCQRVR